MDGDDSDTSSQPDQYARDNGLSIDSQIDPFSFIFRIHDSVPQLTPDAGPSGLTIDTSLPLLHLPTLDLQDQLGAPEECPSQIAKALHHDGSDFNDLFYRPLAHYEARERLLGLKLDQPALFSDPDHDCRKLARAIREQRRAALSPEMFPLERLNMNNDEGLHFPASALHFRRKLERIVLREKLDVPKEAIHHLAYALQDDWSSNERCKLFHEERSHRIFVRDLVVTPPLSPFSGSEEHFIPEPHVCEVPIASDLVSMLGDDVEAAESVILQKEFSKDVPQVLNVNAPVLPSLLAPPATGDARPKIRSFRMETPLSPVTSLPQSFDEQHDNIPNLLRSMVPDHIISPSNSFNMNAPQFDNSDYAFDHDLEIAMLESAAAVRQNLEQQQISIADAIARVEVPNMDFSFPEPGWQSLTTDSRSHLLWLCEFYSIAVPPCPREPRVDSKLRWIPFLGKINYRELTKEEFDCGNSWSLFLGSLDSKEILTSENYVWKRPGLTILHESEIDDFEVALSLPDAKLSLASLARKRRLENSQLETNMRLSPSSNESIDLIVPFQHKRPSQHAPIENLVGNTKILPSTESNLNVATLLSNYINIRSAKRHKSNKSEFFVPSSGTQAALELVPVSESFQTEENNSSLPKTPGLSKKLLTPCPGMMIPNRPTKLIKGLTLSRKLFSMLERLYPAAEIIERDFSRWDTAARSLYPAPRSSVALPLTAEADIIISPATGIIVTTLLKAIQKPVNANAGRSPLRERIAHTALRYEKLIVLVSEGNTIDEAVRDFTVSETEIYAEFIAFLTSLGSHVEVFYVGGGEATLAKWLISFVVQHTPEASSIQEYLIHDETRWEVFLRLAGFNAYAAQAILFRLKARRGGSRESNVYAKCGLSTFMLMTDSERMQNFRELMGGESVLSRVNHMLRMPWK
ncbi:hypothetical protein F5B22DRAFT_222458 [Xylaria bambusicola]|uniref:uncharacterized protein n=1 Tax=Xylaria bambusicola TaxID=326684 RepID=UPI0020079F00|nr:uncharacterized protein F5B22DRAFT_222458 [Xylaria bambusicola]KAI0514851.1 hypothetical protein F5B22DRAFT_222458 [Xylaria bambusicola]